MVQGLLLNFVFRGDFVLEYLCRLPFFRFSFTFGAVGVRCIFHATHHFSLKVLSLFDQLCDAFRTGTRDRRKSLDITRLAGRVRSKSPPLQCCDVENDTLSRPQTCSPMCFLPAA